MSELTAIERKVSRMQTLIIQPVTEEEQEELIDCTTPEMDRYDRVYLDSIPIYLL